jgi:fibronectin-binding autotransporter adhesin
MGSGNTRAGAAVDQIIGWLGIGRLAVPLVVGLVCYVAVAATCGPASAQVGTPGSNAVTGTTLLTGTIDGGGGPGFFVTSGGTLVVNNGSLQNFTTTGGSGAGGGLGAGGAIFIDTGGTAIINNSSFVNNQAVGGAAINAQNGGTLNNGVANNYFAITANGAPGTNDTISPDNIFIFGSGSTNNGGGNGITPCCVGNGGNAINGFGGAGGVGGPATNGWGDNPVLIEGVATSAANLASTSVDVALDGTKVGIFVASAVVDLADIAEIFDAPIAATDAAENAANAIVLGVQVAKDLVSLGADATSLAFAIGDLAAWNQGACVGATGPCTPIFGNGGTGENGGNGGNGSYGFGGGVGGEGGAYGTGGNPYNTAGAGGNGGNGGMGGWGAGGGAGGAGYSSTDYGAAGPISQTPTSNVSGFSAEATGGYGTGTNGSGGAGGSGGFGGGVGCTGGTGLSAPCTGGGGGDGYGGAIFVNVGGALTITGNVTFFGNDAVPGQSQTGGAGGTAAGTDLFMMTGSTVLIAPGAGNIVTFNGTIADDSASSIANPNYPAGSGAGLTIFAGTTVFNGANTYSGQTVVNGGALNGALNTAANNGGAFSTTGAPNYALTDGALQVTQLQTTTTANGVTTTQSVPTLPVTSNLSFAGPDQFTGGVLQTSGTFSRQVGSADTGVQWTGSGGFAAYGGPLTVTLGASSTLGGELVWGANGFVPFGSSLIFGSAMSNNMVTFTNPIDITGGTASILVGNNGDPAGSVATMSGVIAGSGGLSINGGGFNGTLILTAINTYTGPTEIQSGTLSLGGSGSIASSSGLTVDPGATFDISGTTAGVSIPTLSGTGTVALGGKELTVNQTSTFGGSLVDGSGGVGGSLIVSGSGTVLTLTGTNTYTGDTTIDSGATLGLSGLGSIANSTPVIDNGAFDISQSTTIIIGTLSGAAITTLSGNGTVNLGSNLLMITAGAAGAAGTNSNGVFSGVISDGGIACTSPPSGPNCTSGMLAVVGGVQTLSGNNTYTGGTMVASGATLALQGSGTIATSAFLFDNGTFDISQTNGASIKILMGAGTVALGAQELTITSGALFSGVIADGGVYGGTGGSLIVAGGLQMLYGTNTYTGATIIAPNPSPGSAMLALMLTGSIATSSEVEIATGGTFDISMTTSGASIKTLADYGASPNGSVNLGSQKLTITAGSTTFSGVISDGGFVGSLEISGGVQTLAGVNTYTGATMIDTGATLALLNGGSIANSSAVTVNGTGSFDISQTTSGASITTLSGGGNVALGGSGQTLNITAGASPNANGIFSGVIADGGISTTNTTGGNLRISGGVETLSGTNTYTGGTTVDPTAELVLTGTGSIASSKQVTDNGIIDISTTTFGASFTTLAGTNSAASLTLGSQTLTITAGNSTNFAGNISGSGAFTIAGGTQFLSGTNAYTGLTTINSGATLALTGTGSIASSSGIVANGTFDISKSTIGGAMITTLSGGGNVALGGNALVITAGAAGPDGTDPAGIFSGTIADGGLGGGVGGGLAIIGGHQELTGVNTYTGGTVVMMNATLSINNASSLGAATSQLTLNNGTLVVDASITIPQPILVAGTADTINLNTNNVTLTGNITGTNTATLSVINGGTLNLNQTAPNSVSGLVGIVLGPGTSLTANSAANAGLGATPIVVMPSGGGPPIDLFTGSVHVVGPLDVVSTATGTELIILAGDSLVGVGSVNVPTVIQGGGTNAPGDGPGTIVVTASVTDLAGATYSVQIDGPLNSYTNCTNPSGCAGQYSSTVVTGAGNIYTAAGTLAPQLTGIGAPANNTYIPPVTTSFVIVQAAGGVLGSFSSITQPAQGVPGVSGGLAAGTRFDALYGPSTPSALVNENAITLYVTPANYQNLSYWGVSLNENQSQVAAAVNALRGTAGVRNSLGATMDLGALFAQQPSSLPHDFDTLTGEANADAANSTFQMMGQFLELMLEPALNGRSGSVGAAALGFAAEDTGGQPLEIASAYNAVLPAVKAPDFEQRWRTWGSAYGAANTTNGDATLGTHDLSASAYGFVGGMDYRWTADNVIGFAVGSGTTQWGLDQALGGGRGYGLQVGTYTKSYFGSAYLAASLGFANQWMTTDRYAFTGEHLTADFMAQSYGARVEAGYRYAMPWASVTPYAAGQVQAFYTPNYIESDLSGGAAGSFALAYNAATAFDVRSELGARFDSVMPFFNDMQLVWRGRLAWQHEWVNNPTLTATFDTALSSGALPGAASSFTINGAPLPSDSAIVSAGFDVHVTPSLTVGAALDSVLAPSAQTYGGTATLRYRW